MNFTFSLAENFMKRRGGSFHESGGNELPFLKIGAALDWEIVFEKNNHTNSPYPRHFIHQKSVLQPPGKLMEVGKLAYWPVGRAFCIFFGPTPVSIDYTPRAASGVNPIGHIIRDCSALKQLDKPVTAQVSVI